MLTIARVTAFPLRFDLGDATYGSARGLVPARETTLVRVETSDGVVGWGEAFGPGVAAVALIDEIAARLVGTTIDGPVPFATRNALENYHRGLGLHTAALSAIDTALWDVLGRSLGASVATLLGGRARDVLTPYASCGYSRTDRDIGRFADELARDAEGFAGAKIKCGFGVAEDVARAEAAREALGADRSLMIDFNGNYLAPQAAASMRALTSVDPTWIEEPLDPSDESGLDLLRHLGIPLAAGEALYTRAPFRSLLSQRRVDFAQPDLAKVGGITEARAVAELARTWGARLSPHVWGGAISLAAAIQLMASVPTSPHTENVPEPLWLELDRGRNALRDELLTVPIVPSHGLVEVPTGPGLGVEVDEAAVERLRADR